MKHGNGLKWWLLFDLLLQTLARQPAAGLCSENMKNQEDKKVNSLR